jgi:hypothetical protein
VAQKQLLQGLLNTNTASSAAPAAAASSASVSASAPVINVTSEVEMAVPTADLTANTATTGKVHTLLIIALICDSAL